MSGVGLIICQGPMAGTDAKHRCACCGVESDNIESFAPGGMCWMCGFGANLDCPRCIERGVGVSRHSGRRGKLHRTRGWGKGKRHIVTVCGFRIPKDDIGDGAAVLDECRKCWPEEAS